jgi:hypothetical protein
VRVLELGLLAIAAVSLVLITVVVTGRGQLRTPRDRRAPSEAVDAPSGEVARPTDRVSVPPPVQVIRWQPDLLVAETERSDELLVFGQHDVVRSAGEVMRRIPQELVRHAVGTDAIARSIGPAAEAGGFLVRVDATTAAAIRAGRLTTDGSGHMLGLVRGPGGQFTHVARIQQVGGVMASATALSGALSAMALQAQLGRIESALENVSRDVAGLKRTLEIKEAAERQAVTAVLAESYRAAGAAGALTETNWQQVASLGHVIRGQLVADRIRLDDAVRDLRSLSRESPRNRRERLDGVCDSVVAAHASVVRSSASWVQFSSLRLWRLAVTDDPSLGAYEAELRSFLDDSRTIRHGLRRSEAALRDVETFSRRLHPLVARRLPDAVAGARARIQGLDWAPLALETASDGSAPSASTIDLIKGSVR